METRRDVFQAIADPTRREIIGYMAGKVMNINAIAENFSISRPAISKQVKILVECGLVVVKQEGKERYCEVKLEKLNEVSQWIETYKKFWDTKLNTLEDYLKTLQTKRGKHGKKS
jgi:DNA-binding transcriptional ArsR family regulator